MTDSSPSATLMAIGIAALAGVLIAVSTLGRSATLDNTAGVAGPELATIANPITSGERLPRGFVQLAPRDYIEPIYAPEFSPAADVSWPDDAQVIGVSIGDDSRAYPVSVLQSREVVIDTVGSEPIIISWCPVCGTAMAHRRIINGGDGTAAVFGTQGGLYRNAMTWFDHATGSIWSQPLGEAIAGPLVGATVDPLPAQFTTWGAWSDAHPAGVALAAEAVAIGRDLGTLAVVVDLDGEARGFPISGLRSVGVANDQVGSHQIAVVIDPADEDRWMVFDRQINGVTVELEHADGAIRDLTTGSTFDPVTGLGLTGPLRGVVLRHIPAGTSIPGFGPQREIGILTVWPDATIWWPEPPTT